MRVHDRRLLTATLCLILAASAPSPEADRIRGLIQASRYTEAEDRARGLIAESEQAHGPASIETGRALDLLVEAMWRGGRGHLPEARELAERAVAIKEAAGSVEEQEILASRRNLAYVLARSGDRTGAKSLFEQLVASRERLLGPTHPEVAVALIDLANLSLTSGQYAAARPIYERALGIQSGALGARHPDVAKTLTNLALVNQWMGDIDSARTLFERSLAIKEEAFGPDHLDVAWTLNSLAVLLEDAGDYVGARSRYERALEIRRKALGPDHLQVALILNNLGHLLCTMGDYGEAQSLFERALTIEERTLGSEHEDVARTRFNLAEVFHQTGALDRAQVLHEQALRTREKILAPQRAALAESLHALGDVLLEKGDIDAARALHERAVTIWKVAVGEEHPQYAVGLSGLARALARTGAWRESKELLEQAISIQEKSEGADHPDLALNLVHLGEAMTHLGATDRALACFLRAEEIGRRHLRLVVTALSEREALRYASVRPSGLGPALSLVGSARSSASPADIFDMVIRSRLLVLDEMASRRHLAAVAGGEQAQKSLEALTRASRRLASLKIRGPEDQPADQYLHAVELARKEMEEGERALAQESAAFRRSRIKVQAGLREVAAALPPRSCLVGYVRYEDGDFSSYLALLQCSRQAGASLVSLGPSAPIEDLVRVWRQSIASWKPAGPLRDREAETLARTAGESLRHLIWDPVARHLRRIDRVFIVPDGALNLVDFAALPIGENGYLLDEGPLIHYLSSERDLIEKPAPGRAGADLLALGGPDFDLTGPAVASSPLASRRGAESDGSGHSRGPADRCPDWRSIRFGPLPGAALEIEEIGALWSRAASSPSTTGRARQAPSRERAPAVVRLSGPAATEAAFKKNAAGKRVLHLATHGFFLDVPCREAPAGDRGIGGLVPAALSKAAAPHEPGAPTESAAAPVDSPLLLAGLALAGANNRGEAGPDEEDGILTGEEIAAMDLSGVEWAVLSACDTGVGRVMAGEGVLGLRRAFQIAGVATVITSLWPVDDTVAREWMEELYRSRLIEGRSTSEAVREASRRLVRRRRDAAESTHPRFWAGFLASGDWR